MRVQVFGDWRRNRGNQRIALLLLLLRVAQFVRADGSGFRRVLALPPSVIYRAIALSLYSIDIPVSTRIGPGLVIHHGFGVVIHNRAIIGRDVTIRQSTTIGSVQGSQAPTIGDNVDIGAAAVIIGNVSVGRDARVGAAAVVTRDVPERSTVVGNPARVIGGVR